MTAPLHRSRPGGFDIKPASQEAARPINEFVYLSEGLSNSFLVTTSEGRVVINTGMGFEAPVHKRNYDAVDDSPIRYILLTQGHVDHVGGVDLFMQEGTEIVAQARNLAHQVDDARIAQFRAARSSFAFGDVIVKTLHYIHDQLGEIPAQSRPTPTIAFDDEYAFELGGLRFELLATPGGETLDSMVIWLPQHEICFAGNLFSALFGHFPNLVTIRGDRLRSALEFIASLERVRALEPELLLVGHHDPVQGKALIQSELLRLRDAVQYVHDATLAGMNAGKDVRSLMREISLPAELEVGEGYGKLSWSVRAIWEFYAGWFHHGSTTELYPVPASAVHGDLVELAGGADAIAARAKARLDAGEHLEAIQLAEIALTAEPRHAGALEVCIGAHERLDALSVNFWLSSWLRKQLKELRARLAERDQGESRDGH